jgi:hypothetical protein
MSVRLALVSGGQGAGAGRTDVEPSHGDADEVEDDTADEHRYTEKDDLRITNQTALGRWVARGNEPSSGPCAGSESRSLEGLYTSTRHINTRSKR